MSQAKSQADIPFCRKEIVIRKSLLQDAIALGLIRCGQRVPTNMHPHGTADWEIKSIHSQDYVVCV